MAGIDVRKGEHTAIDAIRFHDNAVLKQTDANNLGCDQQYGNRTCSNPKTAVDTFIAAFAGTKQKLFP